MKVTSKIKKDSFFNHSKNYLIAEFFNKGIVFLTIPIFTYLLSPKEYGIIAIYLTITNIFLILMGYNFPTTVTRKYHEDDDFGDFLGINIIFLFFVNILLLFFIFIFKDYLAHLFSIDTNILFIAAIVGSLNIFLGIELSYLKTSQNSKKYAIILVIRTVLLTTGAIVWMYFLSDNRYLGKIYSELIILGIIFLFVIYDLSKISKFNFNIEHIKYSLAYGIPLIPHTLAGLVLLQSDLLIINNLLGSYEAGLYSFAFNVGMLMNVFVISLNNAWIPIFYKNLNEKAYKKIQIMSEYYVKIIFFIALILMLFSEEIVKIMSDERYHDALKVVPIIVLGFVALFLYTLYANYALYRKKTGLVSLFTFIAAFINVGLNYMLIPIYGYIAAAWTTLISYFILFVLHYVNVKFILKENVILLSKILIYLSVLLVEILIYVNIHIENYFLQLTFKIILIIIMLILFFRSEATNFLKGEHSL